MQHHAFLFSTKLYVCVVSVGTTTNNNNYTLYMVLRDH